MYLDSHLHYLLGSSTTCHFFVTINCISSVSDKIVPTRCMATALAVAQEIIDLVKLDTDEGLSRVKAASSNGKSTLLAVSITNVKEVFTSAVDLGILPLLSAFLKAAQTSKRRELVASCFLNIFLASPTLSGTLLLSLLRVTILTGLKEK